jgi:hypothetical protein
VQGNKGEEEDNPNTTVESSYQNRFVMSLVTNSFDHTSFRSLAGDIYARLLAK